MAREYCPECKVTIIEGTCFCDWEDPLDVVTRAPKPLETDANGNPVDMWFPNANPKFKAKLVADQQALGDFKAKIKSISFNRVKGGGRD